MDETENVRKVQRIIGTPYRDEGHVSWDALSDETQAVLLTHSGMTVEQLEKHMRMRNVFSAMRPTDVAVLHNRFIAGRTLEEMGETAGISPQAMDKRIRQARQNFLRAFALKWNEPIDWSTLDPKMDSEEWWEGLVLEEEIDYYAQAEARQGE